MTVQDIIDAAVRDSDNTIGTTHASLIEYVDRVHKDLLRASKWRFLLSDEQSFDTQAGVPDYDLGLADFDKINEQYVIDCTNKRRLFRVFTEPLTVALGFPTTFLLEGQTLSLFNTPKDVYTISYYYYKQRKVLTVASDVLQIPDDYRDVVEAGVNELVAKLQDRNGSNLQTIMYWRGLYQEGKRGMIRDSHPNGLDFIHPDPASATGGYITYPPDPFYL